MRYEKSEIRAGMFIELDCPIRTYTRAPQYGEPLDQSYAEIRQRQAETQRTLEALLRDSRYARRH